MDLYKVTGQYSFYIDVQYDQPLTEKSNITINAFSNRSSRIPIPCKYTWTRNTVPIDHQGNIYLCCASDVGCSLEVQVTSFEDEYDGKAIVKFNPIGISYALERILYSLLSDTQKVVVYAANQSKFEFQQDRISIDNSTIQVRFPDFVINASPQDVKALTLTGNVLASFSVSQKELPLKFHSRDERDIFIACFVSLYAIRHISYRTILDNIGQALQCKDQKQLFHWILTHKVCQVSVSPVKVNIHKDDPHLLKAQNQQLQSAVDSLQSQIRKYQQQSLSTQSGYSDKLQQKNPPVIAKQELMLSPSNNSMEKRYKDEIDYLQRQIEALKQRNSSERINQLQSQVVLLSQENTDLKKKLNFDSEASKKYFANAERAYTSEFQEYDTKKEQKEPLEKMVQSLQQELKTQFIKEKKLQGKIAELEGQCQVLKQQQSQPNLLNQSLLRQSMLTVDDQQIKQLEEKIEEAKRFNNRLKDEIDRQKRKIQQLSEENEYLKKQNLSMSNIQVNNADWKEKLHNLEKENRMLREKQLPSPSKADQKQLDNLITLNQKLVAENSELQRKLRDLEDEVNLIKNLSQSRIVCQGDDFYKNQVEQLEKENQYLHKKIELLKRDSQTNMFQEKNLDERDKVKQLEAQLQKFKTQSQRYMEENMKLFDEIRVLKDQIDMQDSRMNNSVVENGLKQENDHLRQQVQELRNEVQAITRMKQSQRANASQQGVSDDSVKLLKMELENDQLKQQIKELQLRQFSTGNSSIIREKDVSEEIQLLQMQVQRLQQTNQRAMEQNTMLMDQVKRLQEELCSKSLSQSRIELSEIMEKPNFRGWGI